MKTTGAAWCCTLLLIAVLAGACGPGSSGFDVVPEGAAIATALRERRCVLHEALRICPADVPPPGAAVPIITGTLAGGPTCPPPDSTGLCEVEVRVTPAAAGPERTFRLAVRAAGPGAGWLVGPAVVAAPDADVPLPLRAPADGLVHEPVVILVFPAAAPDVPRRLPSLAASGALLALVLPGDAPGQPAAGPARTDQRP